MATWLTRGAPTTDPLNVTLARQISGEDLTSDVMKVETRWKYVTCSQAAAGPTTFVVAPVGPALYGGFYCNSTAGGTVIVYDAAAGATTNILVPSTTPVALTLYQWPPVICPLGIQVVLATAAVNLTVFYQLATRA